MNWGCGMKNSGYRDFKDRIIFIITIAGMIFGWGYSWSRINFQIERNREEIIEIKKKIDNSENTLTEIMSELYNEIREISEKIERR